LTTTFGNTDVETATANTLRMLELVGRARLVSPRGPGRPLMKPFLRGAEHVHGRNGLGNIVLPEPKTQSVAEHASDLMIRVSRENPGEITLCPSDRPRMSRSRSPRRPRSRG
jgi:purine nucleosidase